MHTEPRIFSVLHVVGRADHPMLINPPEELTQEHPEIPVFNDYDELREPILSLSETTVEQENPDEEPSISV